MASVPCLCLQPVDEVDDVEETARRAIADTGPGDGDGQTGYACSYAPDEHGVAPMGRRYPNPMAFAGGTQAMPDRLQLRAITGSAHGDLHDNNILVSDANTADLDYDLIDLALYMGGQLLFYDHAYFEPSRVLNSRLEAAFSRWQSILEAIGKPDPGAVATATSRDDLGPTEIAKALRKQAFDWIGRHEPDRLSYMESQRLLARVAVGLSFVHKNLAQHARCLAFVYAADNLKRLLALHAVDGRDDAPLHGENTGPGSGYVACRPSAVSLTTRSR